jgi:hypothetical protein
VATGIQDKFSWNAVALAAISGGFGGATGAGSNFGVGGSGMGSAMLRSAVVNTASQGFGLALGLQNEFSWAGVAAAAAAPWISKQANLENTSPGATLVARNSASAMVDAAARTLFEGGDFGDNLMAALPSVIGQTVGEVFAGAIAYDRSSPTEREGFANGDKPIVGAKGNGSSKLPTKHMKTPGFDDVGEIVVNGHRNYYQPEESSLMRTLRTVVPGSLGGDFAGGFGFGDRVASPPSFIQRARTMLWDNAFAMTDLHRERAMNSFAAAQANEAQNTELMPGFDTLFNNVESTLLYTSGAIEWTLAPLSGPADAWFGPLLTTVSNGRIGPTFPSDTSLAIGSMFFGGPVNRGVRATPVSGAATIGSEVRDELAARVNSQRPLSLHEVVAADKGLIALGVRDADLRHAMIVSRFDPSIMADVTTSTRRRFDYLFQGALDRGASLAGGHGTIETRVAAITSAAALERRGFTVSFEVPYFNSAGKRRVADLMGIQNGQGLILQLETIPSSRTAIGNQRFLRRQSQYPVEIVPVSLRSQKVRR